MKDNSLLRDITHWLENDTNALQLANGQNIKDLFTLNKKK